MTQLDWSVGVGRETTYGVAVAPTRFFETPAQMDMTIDTVQGSGFRPTKRVNRSNRHSIARTSVAGDFELEIPDRGFGMLLEAVLGVPVVSPVAISGRRAQIYTLRNVDPVPSYTIEEMLPQLGLGNVVQKFTGCVAESLTIEMSEGGYTTAKISWLGKDMLTTGTATAAVYPTDDQLLNWTQGQIMIGGVQASNVTKFSLTVKNNLDTAGFNLGGGGKRSRINAIGKAEITGSITAEFTDTILRNWTVSQIGQPLVVNSFAATQNKGTETAALEMVIGHARIKGGIPKSNAGSVIEQSIDFEAFDPGAADPLTITYNSPDTAP